MDFYERYDDRYKNLNAEQQRAVNSIDGPVAVIAGPGTGKTELLSMRVANILKQTDIQPENILCLTYTDSGVYAMRKRLTEIIGERAYKVAIHTFHSFGTEVISQNREFFFNGANFKPGDDLTAHETLSQILGKLPLGHPLASQMNDSFTRLKDIQSVIQELKKAGLTASELVEVLDNNQASIDQANDILRDIFSQKISKATVTALTSAVHDLSTIDPPEEVYEIPAFLPLLLNDLSIAIDEAENHPRVTPPLTAWRNKWLRKDQTGNYVLKAVDQQAKLRLVAGIYSDYTQAMQQSENYDFDDMILQVISAMEQYDDLRYNLQEKYQYFMVDEFQDTNLAQLRILKQLTDNPVNEGRPNIFVVGDPDQAIYSFQGADINNIHEFKATYPNAEEIVLTKNYRSTQSILDESRAVIKLSEERFANSYPELDQALQSQSQTNSEPMLYEISSNAHERAWLAEQIRAKIDSGVAPSDIAILMLNHKDLQAVLPYLRAADIDVNYERQDNALSLEPVSALVKLANLVNYLAHGRHDDANALIPEIIAHPAWKFSAENIWRLSSLSFDQGKRWLDVMEGIDEFILWRQWIIELAAASSNTQLEIMLDRLIGVPNISEIQPESTLYNFYFTADSLNENPAEYANYLNGLRAIREKVMNYKPNAALMLSDFIDCINLYQSAQVGISVTQHIGENTNSIHLMTTHKSKGLEFKHVYLPGVTEDRWRSSAGKSNTLSYPANMTAVRKDASADERLRLFYVAMTRAKQELIISYGKISDTGKELLPASFLAGRQAVNIPAPDDIKTNNYINEVAWYYPVVAPRQELREFLRPQLERYRLSATHLTHFLDLEYGGPDAFLVSHFLHFPSASTAHIKYGNAIHNTLENLHASYLVDGKLPSIDKILAIFDKKLATYRLTPDEIKQYVEKGHEELTAYLSNKAGDFKSTQKPELNLGIEQPQLDEVRLSGKIDLTDIDSVNKTLFVTDYKTGKPEPKWSNSSSKLHRYKQQLMFYKLLLENSRSYHYYKVTGGAIDFIKPLSQGENISLELEFNEEEMARFVELVKAVWKHIVEFDFPDTSGYSADLKGIKAFEDDLISGKI